MKKRRSILAVPLLLVTGALLTAAFFLPDALFHLHRTQQEEQILVKDITAIDLTLTEHLTRAERMAFVSDPQTMKLPANTHTNSRNAAEYAATRFVHDWFRNMGAEMPTPDIADSTPYLFTNPKQGQTMLCWSILFRFPAAWLGNDGVFFVRLTVDETEFEVLQVSLHATNDVDCHVMICESLCGMLDRPFPDYTTIWKELGDNVLIDEDVKYEKPLPKYTASEMQLLSESSSFAFQFYETPRAVLFNIGDADAVYEQISLLY